MTTRIGIGMSSASLTARTSLNRSMGMFDKVNEKLATGIKINRGSDNPAGLIAMEQLQAELTAIEAAAQNTSRAGQVINVMDSALAQVGSLLSDLNGSIVGAAGAFTDAERKSYALQAQETIGAIERIGASTQFGDLQLLDGSTGSMSFAVSPDLANSPSIDLPKINAASLGGDAGMLIDLLGDGSANLASGDLQQAQQIVSAARTQVSECRATLGAFQKNTLETNQATLSSAQINLTKGLSEIADTDFAVAASEQTRFGVLIETGINSLLIANNSRSGMLRFFD